jgi:hypothetical protein
MAPRCDALHLCHHEASKIRLVKRPELEELQRVARAAAVGLPIDTDVQYDERASRLVVRCRSRRALLDADGGGRRDNSHQEEWSPTVSDYSDLNGYVQNCVERFVGEWIRSKQ